MWFKEYIFNALIQPFHLLIYTILVGAAVELVTKSVIYGVVAIGFITPAEKLMRKFFGFDNAGTLSATGAFAGGAMFQSIMNKLNRPKGKPGGDGDDKEKDTKVRQANSGGGGVDADRTLIGGSGSSGSGKNGSPTGGPGGSNQNGPNNGGDNQSQENQGKQENGGATVENGALPDPTFKDETHMSVFDRIANKGLHAGDMVRGAAYTHYYNAKKKIKGTPKKATKAAGRYIRKGIVGAIPGGALGAMGLAMGVASGDLSKAAQYGALGATAGYNFANHYGDKVAKVGGNVVKGGAQSASDAFWGDEAKKRSQYKFDKAWKENPQNIDALTKTLGSRDLALQAIKDGSVQALLNNNITDAKYVGKALKLKNGYVGKGMSEDDALNRAVSIAKWHRDSGTGIYEKNSHAEQVFINQTVSQIMGNNPGMSESEATDRVKQILADMASFES